MPYDGIYIYIHGTPPRPTFSTLHTDTNYILYNYTRFLGCLWKAKSHVSSLTSGDSCLSQVWPFHPRGSKIQDPRFPQGLGPGILDPGGLAGSKIQDPRFRGGLGPGILDPWIQDFPRRVSGHLGSWILDPGLLDPRFPKKSLWVSWILDPGLLPGLLDPRFPKKSFCPGLLDPRFHKKSLWASWILDPSLRNPRFHNVGIQGGWDTGVTGSQVWTWDLKSEPGISSPNTGSPVSSAIWETDIDNIVSEGNSWKHVSLFGFPVHGWKDVEADETTFDKRDLSAMVELDDAKKPIEWEQWCWIVQGENLKHWCCSTCNRFAPIVALRGLVLWGRLNGAQKPRSGCRIEKLFCTVTQRKATESVCQEFCMTAWFTARSGRKSVVPGSGFHHDM